MFNILSPIYGHVRIPKGVNNLNAYRAWVHSPGALPRKLAAHFLRGDVWMDLCPEHAFSHNLVKTAVIVRSAQIERECNSGIVFSNRMLLTNDDAEFGTEPDSMFITHESYAAKRVWFAGGERTGGDPTEVVGAPDIVVEVVSDSTKEKDTVWLKESYFVAGIPEYWLIDARQEPLQFNIYRRGPKGYTATRKIEGWTKSRILGKSFRFEVVPGAFGKQNYALEVR